MFKQGTYLVLPIVMLALILGSVAQGAFNPLKDPALVGWWTCDDGQGTIVTDSSSNHRDGTAYAGLGGAALVGTLKWGPGVHGGAVELTYPNLIQIPAINITMTQSTMAGWLKPLGAQAAWSSIIMTRGSATGLNINPDAGNLQLCYHWGDASNTWSYRPNAYVINNEWTFAAVTVEPTKATFYVNGVPAATNSVAHGSVNWNAPICLGGDGSGTQDPRRLTDGMLDDVSLFSRALTADEIMEIMKGLGNPVAASVPIPADGATDVPQDASLAWTAGPYARTHDVYLGKAFADVNDASRASPGTALASQAQAATTYTPAALLEFGQTYFWRVDEVNAPPTGTIFKGDVWSFTAEPYAYPIENVTAKASSVQGTSGPEKTIDGSGLNASDQHSANLADMWMSTAAKPHWIQYEFDKVYKVHELWVWNSNQIIESFLGFGAKTVKIEYSADGTTWTELAGVPEFGKAPGTPDYAADTAVSFGGVEAKFVKLTIDATWGGVAPQTSLSEVRFFYVPVQARAPEPAAGATGVAPDTVLNWRPGRGATSHKVFFGTDKDAVTNGAATAKTVTEHSFDAGSLTFGTPYYWRVDEVGETVTYPGDVWTFTTQEFAAADDFESYTDDEGSRIYETWVDGLTTGLSGSMVGYMLAPFAERTIIHGGKQSMPLEYNNVKTPYYSEADREFQPVQDWTGGGATTLSLWFRGNPPSFIDKGGNALTVSAGGNDIWNNADAFRFVYKRLTGNGSITARVESVVNTNGWAKAGVMIRDTLAAGSPHGDVVVTPSNSCSFQRRTIADGASASVDWTGTAVTAPYWVRLTRTGTALKAETSPDGKTWTALGTDQIVLMGSNIYIGLCVTSHNVAQITTAEFSNVTTTGTVTGAWQAAAIGSDPQPANSAEKLYVVVQDSAGKSKMVVHPDPAATASANWQQWLVPLSEFTSAGLKMTSVKKLVIGVGDKSSPKAGGGGMLYIDDIGFGKAAQ